MGNSPSGGYDGNNGAGDVQDPARAGGQPGEKPGDRDAFKALVRQMVKFRFENPVITNADRVRCGLHPRDPVKTPIGDPTTAPVIAELHPLGNSRVEIRAHDEATPDSRAIPYGYNGCLLKCTWGRSASPTTPP